MSECKLINTERLFSHVLPSIGSKNRIIEEIVENAVRAKSAKLNITLSKEGEISTLLVENDGEILEDFRSLLVVADSSYDDDVIAAHDPAGMGIYLMIAASTSITFHSGSKALTVHCQKFLNNETYREGVLDTVYDAEPFHGFRMRLTIEGGTDFIDKMFLGPFPSQANEGECQEVYAKTLAYYPIDISYNGVRVKRETLPWMLSKMGEGVLEGVRIGIRSDCVYRVKTDCGEGVLWHGKWIEGGLGIFTIEVTGSAVTRCVSPRLPDRTQLANTSDELSALVEEIERQLKVEIQSWLYDNPDSDLIASLNLAYDVEHYTKWNGAEKGVTKLIIDSSCKVNFCIVEGDGDLLKPFDLLEAADIDFGEAPIVGTYGKDSTRGGTPAPKWYESIPYTESAHIVAYGSPRHRAAARASNEYYIYPCTKLLFDGYEITGLRDSDDKMYVWLEADEKDSFFESAAERFGSWVGASELDDIWYEWEVIYDAIDMRVSGVSDLFLSLRRLVGASWDDEITALNFNIEASKITFQCNGKTHTVSF